MRPLVSVFCRAPRPGRTKTRLTPPLTPAEAAALSADLLLDVIDGLRHPGLDLEACAAAADDLPALAALVPPEVPVVAQGLGDLGARMAEVLRARLATGRPAVVLVGADCPTLTAHDVCGALDALAAGAEAAVCPSSDGGYSLIALRRPAPALFRDVAWSGPDVLAATRRNARAAGLRLAELPPVDDVDRYDDLLRLAGRLARPDAPAAPRTRRALARLGIPVRELTARPPAGTPARAG